MLPFVILSSQFYSNHLNDSEIEQKKDRPHAKILLKIEGITFAIPFRSNISHPYAFFTDKPKQRGLDYSKAIVILDDAADIDHTQSPHIRQNEFNALKGKDASVEIGMRRYLKAYQRAKLKPDNPRNALLLQYSTLKYFDPYLPINLSHKKAS